MGWLVLMGEDFQNTVIKLIWRRCRNFSGGSRLSVGKFSIGRGKDLSGRGTLCETIQKLIFGELHVVRFYYYFFMEYEVGWVDYFLETSHSFTRV